MTSFLKPVVATLLLAGSIGAFAYTAAEINSPAAWGENDAVIQGQNLPGGQSEMGKTDVHVINLGYKETCRMESWLLPFEYENVADFLEEHPDAQPDYEGPQPYSSKCDENGYQEAREKAGLPTGYYNGITGSIHKFSYPDSAESEQM